MKIVYERRLSDVICGVVAIILGAAGLFLPYPISRIVGEAFPGGTVSILYGGLLLAGVVVIYGFSSKRLNGLGYMLCGLFLTTSFFLAYGITALVQAWPITIVAATPYLVLSATNIFRIIELTRGSRIARAEASLRN